MSLRAVGIGMIGLALGVAGMGQAVEEEVGRSPWGYWVDLGANFMPGVNATPQNSLGAPGTTIELDTGMRLDAGVGYSLTPWLQVGLATGYSQNGIHSVVGWEVSGGSIDQVPFQVELRFAHGFGDRWEVFAGGGGGGVYLRSDSASSDQIWSEGGSSDVVPGYSVFGGVNYRVWRTVWVGGSYRYAVTGEQTWVLEYNEPRTQQPVDVDPVRSHGVTVFFRAEF